MAIVNRSKRQLKLVEAKTNTLGPGSYDIDYELVTPKIVAAKIYNEPPCKSKQQKNNTKQHRDCHQQQLKIEKENIVARNQEQGLYVTQKKKMGIMERSKTKRADLMHWSIVPGPGSYKVEKDLLKPSQKYEGPKLQKSHILQQIFKTPYYQNVMTTPDLTQFENELDQIHKHKLPLKYYCSIKDPGYTLSKQQRFKQNQNVSGDNPGPGTYNVKDQVKRSKQSRTHNYCQFMQKQISRITQDTANMSDCSEQSIQYIQQAIPGPGSYNLSQSNKTFSKSAQKFGSTAQRFVAQKVVCQTIPTHQQIKPLKRCNKKGVSFGRSKSSILAKRSDDMYEIGPGTYDDRRSTQYRLQEQLSKCPNRNFGSNSRRFKQFKPQYQNRTDFYMGQTTANQFQDEQMRTQTCAFKSRTSQGQSYLIRKDYTTQNCYSQDYHSINKRIKQSNLKATEKVVLQPPFNTGVVRFKYQVKHQEENDQDEVIEYSSNFPRRQQRRGMTFTKAVSETKKNTNPGPGTYNQNNKWNRRTHNILFLS